MKDKAKLNKIIELSEKNLSLIKKNWEEYPKKDYKNIAYLDGRKIPFEYLAFHIGPKNQNLLKASKIDKNIDLTFKHVFFSTSISDLEYYMESKTGEFIKSNSKEMVYFIDLRKLTEGRVQRVYIHKVIFQDDLSKKVEEFKNKKCNLKSVKNSVNNWFIKYTSNYNPCRLKRYKKREDYILVKSPIKVSLKP